MNLYRYYGKIIHLTNDIKISYSKKNSCLYIYNGKGIFLLFLPAYYFCKQISKSQLSFLFLNNFFFYSFKKQVILLSMRLKLFFFFKLRIRGLGFRVRNISNVIYYFFFNYTNFFYLYPPQLLLIRIYKKRILLLSFNWFLLKLVLSHILLLRKMGPYNFLGLRYKRQIILLKKSGKKV